MIGRKALLAASACLLLTEPMGIIRGGPDDDIAERLRTRIESAGLVTEFRVAGDPVYAHLALPEFYRGRAFHPAWSSSGTLRPAAYELVTAIREADQEGLRPDDYHLAEVDQLMSEVRRARRQGVAPQPGRLTDLDLVLTDAFLVYASHLLSGRINPETIDPEWLANRRGMDLAPLLTAALEGDSVTATLNGLKPPQLGYARLRKALADYRAVAADGGWGVVTAGPTLKVGDHGERVVALRRRLMATRDLPDSSAMSDVFDEELARAVRRFQERHGLAGTGTLEPATADELNVPASVRVDQIGLNLERWRWLPQDLGQRYVLVNIAAFDLMVVDSGRPALEMRVMVGRPYRRTPVFTDTMRYLVLSPYWHVPRNLAVEDKLPLIKKDPTYLTKQKMHVFEGWGADTREIDPATIDWSKLSARNFPYRLRQDPGPLNALGRVKFMFPNRFNVYLHDTPSRELFARASRDFSSGCIRLENPIDLAVYLLSDQPGWTRAKIVEVAEAGVEKTVPLPKPLPVHVLYWTAWADADGTIQFRRDLYGRDRRLETALSVPAPAEEE